MGIFQNTNEFIPTRLTARGGNVLFEARVRVTEPTPLGRSILGRLLRISQTPKAEAIIRGDRDRVRKSLGSFSYYFGKWSGWGPR